MSLGAADNWVPSGVCDNAYDRACRLYLQMSLRALHLLCAQNLSSDREGFHRLKFQAQLWFWIKLRCGALTLSQILARLFCFFSQCFGFYEKKLVYWPPGREQI